MFYALASRVSVNVKHDSMLTMWLCAYVILLPECLWVKVGSLELEQLVEIRIVAYLRVANFKPFSEQTDMQCFVLN